MVIDEKKTIILQFFLNSKDQIPREILGKEDESCIGKLPPMASKDPLIIDHEPNCNISKFPEDLWRSGYHIKDVSWQHRAENVYVVRFFLSKKRESTYKENLFSDALAILAESGYWRVWSFANPQRVKVNFGNVYIPDNEEEKSTSYLYMMNGNIQIEIFS